jgi:spore coat polysaccharide biosynthesis protein SpsF
MAERVVAIVQARLASARLPQKVLAPIGGVPLILHVIARARAIQGVDLVVAAVPEHDDALIRLLDDFDVPVFMGDEQNVLQRFARAAVATAAHLVLRITGDCPLFAPDVADALITMWRGADVQPKALTLGRLPQYASNDTTRSGFPDGLDCELFPAHQLYEADAHATTARDREHVTPWIRAMALRTLLLKNPVDCSSVKLSVDTEEDLARVRTIYDRLPNKKDFSFAATRVACGFNLIRQLPTQKGLPS